MLGSTRNGNPPIFHNARPDKQEDLDKDHYFRFSSENGKLTIPRFGFSAQTREGTRESEIQRQAYLTLLTAMWLPSRIHIFVRPLHRR